MENIIFIFFIVFQPADTNHPNIQDIPDECVREILKRLDNHNDIKVMIIDYVLTKATFMRAWKFFFRTVSLTFLHIDNFMECMDLRLYIQYHEHLS